MAACEELRAQLEKAREEERFSDCEAIEIEMVKAGCVGDPVVTTQDSGGTGNPTDPDKPGGKPKP